MRVTGCPSAEELAAILAVLARRSDPEPDTFTRWRRTRQAVTHPGSPLHGRTAQITASTTE